MWPLSEGDIATVPPEYLPTMDELQNMQYPWEIWKHILEKMERALQEQVISDDVKIDDPEKVYIEGPVWIGRGVRIMPFAEIKGPAYIGEGALIGDQSIVRGSVIGAKTIVGERTSIIRSVIGDGCRFHLNYIGDSILGSRVNMGGGTKTGNVRVDDKHIIFHTQDKGRLETEIPTFGAVIGSDTRFAANGFTMPGLLVGKNCHISTGAIIIRNLPDNSQVQLVQDNRISQR